MLHCHSCLMSQPRRILCGDIRKPSIRTVIFKKMLLLYRWILIVRFCCILSLKEFSSQCAVTVSRVSWKERKQERMKEQHCYCVCAYKSFHSAPYLFLGYCRHNCLYKPCAWKEKNVQKSAEEVSIINLWCQPSSPTLLICSTTVLQWSRICPCLPFKQNIPFMRVILKE